jgi:transcription factor IIIB subunit 2
LLTASTSLALTRFNDRLYFQVNVFELGSTYLKLVRKLAISGIPLIDPSIYIGRFAALLEFGEDTSQIAADATKLAQRFARDWMATGRRPSGICGACLILAARMNNYRRSMAEIVQVVKIADVTLMKRLKEFQATQVGSLTVQQFRSELFVEVAPEAKPPAMIRNEKKEKERIRALAAAAERAAMESDDEEDGDEETAANKKRKIDGAIGDERRRVRSAICATPARGSSLAPSQSGQTCPVTPTSAALLASPSPSPFHRDNRSMSPRAALASLQAEMDRANGPITSNKKAADPSEIIRRIETGGASDEDGDETFNLEEQAMEAEEEKDDLDNPVVDEGITAEILDAMAQEQPAALAEELELAEQSRLQELQERLAAQNAEDDLKGLDDDELDGYLLNEQQVQAKTIIWNKFNHEYMVKLNGALFLCGP